MVEYNRIFYITFLHIHLQCSNEKTFLQDFLENLEEMFSPDSSLWIMNHWLYNLSSKLLTILGFTIHKYDFLSAQITELNPSESEVRASYVTIAAYSMFPWNVSPLWIWSTSLSNVKRRLTLWKHWNISRYNISYSFSGPNNYCTMESFNASCPQDHVIVMRTARYGRMRIGRCVKESYGNLGCSVDVLDYIDTKCSGRNICRYVEITMCLFKKMWFEN